ncbi:scaffold/adaptor protein [Lithospermum erythrorhizon]|uniref:Scaffold/adaptor protein n=1 Tax=Lithospermum erythrorhizon TaxID=34254 RepID=A0AAV3QQX8_LITER
MQCCSTYISQKNIVLPKSSNYYYNVKTILSIQLLSMDQLRRLQLKRTLSIQSCFPERLSTAPDSGTSTHQHTASDSDILSHTGVLSPPVTAPPTMFQTSPLGFKPPRNLAMYVPLYIAALKGDWEKAREFISLHPHAVTARITKGEETALHIAAGAKQTRFVEELVKLMEPSDLTLQSKYDNTALCFAAASGITKIANILVAKNNDLPMVRGSQGVTPLYMAALLGHREMTWFLYYVTDGNCLNKEDYVGLLLAVINSDLFDIAVHILQCHPEVATERGPNGETALHVLARKPSAFSGTWMQLGSQHDYSSVLPGHQSNPFSTGILGAVLEKKVLRLQVQELLRCLWKEMLLQLDDSEIGNILKSPSRPVFVAAANGNFNFIAEILSSYPDLIWKVDEESRSIFHIAVLHRQEKIFRLIYDIGALKDLITAYKSSDDTLQMQRELLWFKVVENIVQPSYKEMKNSEGLTPRALFSEEHKRLKEGGEKWMKDTASSCMLVATLITTVMFAAILTVPGGNNNNNGIPIFHQKKSFLLFCISDAVALFSSVTSILMFLSILTSRYAEDDFLESLPKKLITGLMTLFLSIVSMLIAFTASFFIVMGYHLAWVIILVALCACIPVTLFAFLQFPLLADTIRSTYFRGFFCGHSVNIF